MPAPLPPLSLGAVAHPYGHFLLPPLPSPQLQRPAPPMQLMASLRLVALKAVDLTC